MNHGAKTLDAEALTLSCFFLLEIKLGIEI